MRREPPLIELRNRIVAVQGGRHLCLISQDVYHLANITKPAADRPKGIWSSDAVYGENQLTSGSMMV